MRNEEGEIRNELRIYTRKTKKQRRVLTSLRREGDRLLIFYIFEFCFKRGRNRVFELVGRAVESS